MRAPEALVLDLVEWIAKEPRPYRQVMAAWRISCPRLPVWENAADRALATRVREGKVMMIRVTEAGRRCLQDADLCVHSGIRIGEARGEDDDQSSG